MHYYTAHQHTYMYMYMHALDTCTYMCINGINFAYLEGFDTGYIYYTSTLP